MSFASRLGSAALAGVLGVLALAPGGPAWLAWGALVPLFLALRDARGGTTVALAVAYAVVLGLGGLTPWLSRAAAAYFDLDRGHAVAYTLAFLVPVFAAHGTLLGLLLLGRPRRVGPADVVWCGAAWASWDALRTAVFPRFPGAVLGLSQHATVPVLQVASACGLAGISFVVAAFNAGVASMLPGGTAPRRARALAAATGVAIAVGAGAWGARRVAVEGMAGSAPGPRIAAVDVDAARAADGTLDRYVAASEGAVAAAPALLVWPESALTTDPEHDRAAWATLNRFVDAHATPLLAGGPGSVRRGAAGLAHFNAAHLLTPAHGMRSYHKRGLVPFAERWPALLGAPPSGVESLDAGDEATVFGTGDGAFGVLICFEITDGAAARALVRRGARFIVNLTNDAWFPAAAPHLPWAAVRAVETGLPVVRAANAGVSAVFDRFGREVAVSRPAGAPAVLTAGVPPGAPSLYARSGDVFLVACLAVVLAGLIGAVVRRRAARSP